MNIRNWIKRKLCRHKWEWISSERISLHTPYHTKIAHIRCTKCNKQIVGFAMDVRNKFSVVV